LKKLNLGEVYADNKDFRTESQPKVPDLSITPADGKMYETNFNITVAAKGPADENKGLTYMLWGEIIKSDSSETELIKLTDVYKSVTDEPWTSMQFPFLQKVKVVIRDSKGETNEASKEVQV